MSICTPVPILRSQVKDLPKFSNFLLISHDLQSLIIQEVLFFCFQIKEFWVSCSQNNSSRHCKHQPSTIKFPALPHVISFLDNCLNGLLGKLKLRIFKFLLANILEQLWWVFNCWRWGINVLAWFDNKEYLVLVNYLTQTIRKVQDCIISLLL